MQETPLALTGTPTRTGEQQDFDTLFLAHWDEMYRLLYRMLGDDAEDAAQEVFLKLYRKPPRPGSNYRAWLYRVATNEGLNCLRSRTRQAGLTGRLQALWNRNAELDSSEIVQSRDEQAAVRRVLARMRPLYAEALLLRHQGLAYSELAAVLGTTTGSVGTLLARAEAQFARLYEETGGNV